ncbi:unnamed protein product, partial [Chrysoparadoxa australica]
EDEEEDISAAKTLRQGSSWSKRYDDIQDHSFDQREAEVEQQEVPVEGFEGYEGSDDGFDDERDWGELGGASNPPRNDWDAPLIPHHGAPSHTAHCIRPGPGITHLPQGKPPSSQRQGAWQNEGLGYSGHGS